MGYRLGPHVLRPSPEALAFAKIAPCVKSVDDLTALRAAPASSLKIFRHFFANQDLTTPRDAVNAILAALQGYRDPLLVCELYNEIGRGDRDKYAWFCQTAVPLLHDAGVLVAGPGFATGDYEQADWDAFRAINFDYWSLHSYWDPGKLDQWEAYRYRTYWRPGDRPILITECGRRMGNHDLAELVAYAHETAKDAYVAAVTPFSAGPSNDWMPFTIDPLVTDLIKQLGYGENVVNIGPGMKKAIPFLGQPIEDQAYHFAGSDHEVGVAVFEFGYAAWDKKNNETWAHCNDGRSWRDFGNASKDGGALHQVTNPF